MLRSYESSSLLSMRSLARTSSDLVGLCQRGTTPLPQGGGDSGRGCLMIHKYVVAPMVACRVSVRWFAWEVMLFSPRARRCETLQTFSVGDGLTRKLIADCCVCIATIMFWRCLGSVIASRLAVSRLDGCRCIWWTCHVEWLARRVCLSVPARAATAALQVPDLRGGTRDGLYRPLQPLAGVFARFCDDNSKC
jgi:hypothetical protein